MAHVITLAFYPVISRLYTAVEIGEYALFHSCVVLISVVATLAYEHAVVIPKDENDAKQLFLCALFSTLVLSSVLLVAGILFLPFWTTTFGLGTLFILLLPFGVLFNSLMNITTNWFTRKTYYKDLSISKISQTSVAGSSQTLFALASMSNMGMIYGHIAGRAAFVFYQCVKKAADFRYLFSNIRFSKVFSLSKLYSNQPKFVLASTLLTFISIEIPIFLIGALFNTELLGFYGLGYRIVSAPVMLIGTSVGHVFFQQLSDRFNQKKPLTSFLYKTWGGLALAGFIPFLLLYLYAVPVIEFALGDDWTTTGQIVSILSPYLYIKFITSPTGKTLMVINRQQVMPVFSSLYIIASAASLITGSLYFEFFTTLWIMVFANILVAVSYSGYIALQVYKTENRKPV